MADQADASSRSAAKPAVPSEPHAQAPALQLKELTAKSASIGSWQVGIFHPQLQRYEYQWEGQPRKGVNFFCYLVSTLDPTQYCLGEGKPNRGGDEAPLQALQEKFQEALVFNISKVSLVKDVKKQFLSTPLHIKVDLRNTTVSPVLKSPTHVTQPAPGNNIADCLHITTNQQFDVTALIQDMSEQLPGGTSARMKRVRADLVLVDGSKWTSAAKPGETKTMLSMTMFADKESSQEPEQFRELRKMYAAGKAVSFFRITGTKNAKEGTFTFTASRDFHWIEATSEKAKQLNENSSSILASAGEMLPKSVLQSRTENTDYSQQPGIETTCRLFKSIMRKTQLSSIESTETVWQINWARVEEPSPGAQIHTNNGERIWFQTTVRDCSAQINVYIREKAAMSLSGANSPQEFEQAFQDNNLWFPQMASIKLVRKPPTPATPDNSWAAKPASSQEVFCYIVEAEPQNLLEGPTLVSMKMIPLLNTQEDTTDAVLPVSLSMVQKSRHYGLTVQYTLHGRSIVRSCAQVLALVESTSKTQCLRVGEDAHAGFRMTTDNVRDLLDEPDTDVSGSASCQAACVEFSLTAFCTIANVPSYSLTPPRTTKKQAALVLISDILQEQPLNFLVDSIQLLQIEEATQAKPILKQVMHFTAEASDDQGEKRSAAEWTEEQNPAKAAKCRDLSRSPTGSNLPEYSGAKW